MPKKKITLADFEKSPVLKAHSMKSKAVARALDERADSLPCSKVVMSASVSPDGRVKLGTLLSEIGRQAGLSDDELASFERARGK